MIRKVPVTFSHVGMGCGDPAETEDYYIRHFGFRRVRFVDLGDQQLIFLATQDGGFRLELFKAKVPAPFPPPGGDGPQWPALKHLAFSVSDLDAFLGAMGPAARITQGPIDLGGLLLGWKAVWLADPDGRIVEVSQGYRDETV